MTLLTSLRQLVDSGMTQREIARELGCSQSNVSQLIHGKIGGARPSAKIVAGIERLLSAQQAAVNSDQPPPEISPDSSLLVKSLWSTRRFANFEAIAWFMELPPENRPEFFAKHRLISSALCVEELNRIKAATKRGC
jgi:transcriptional regulator with XRE-family HTH domain